MRNPSLLFCILICRVFCCWCFFSLYQPVTSNACVCSVCVRACVCVCACVCARSCTWVCLLACFFIVLIWLTGGCHLPCVSCLASDCCLGLALAKAFYCRVLVFNAQSTLTDTTKHSSSKHESRVCFFLFSPSFLFSLFFGFC